MGSARFVRIGVAVLMGVLLLAPLTLGDWPQWGGPRRDFSVSGPDVKPWSEAGPPVLWKRDFFPGFSAVVAGEGRLISMYRRDDHEVVVAVSGQTGETVWEHAYPAPAVHDPSSLDTSYGAGPNSTPLIAGPNVYTLGFTGVLSCIRVRDGKPLWTRNLAAEGVPTPYFGHASSPIRYRDTVIAVAGGAHAFDLSSGEPRWSNTSFYGSYASPALIERKSQQLLVVAGAGVVVALNPNDGEALWRHEHANQHRTILSSPAVADDDWIFVSAYFLGSIGLQLAEDGASAVERWENPRLQLSYSNAVRAGNWVYGFHNSILTAIDVKTGEIGWRHRGIRKANLLRVGKRFLILDDLGRLLLASLTPKGITVHADSQVFAGRAWTVPTLDNRTLIIRTEDTLMALDLSGRSHARSGPATASPAGTGKIEPPAGFMEAKRELSSAIYAADPVALEASRSTFARWTTGDAASLAHYYIGLAAWRQALAMEGKEALALVDLAVSSLEAALRSRREFADAHALLGRLYPMYYRLDRRRASVIGPKGDEHLDLALLHAPDNPRAVAAHAVDLLNSPVDHGGDRRAGIERLRRALALFESAPAENSSAKPDWGHAMTWYAYGRALLGDETPDRDAARTAFERALAIEPRFAGARRQLETLKSRDNPP